MPIAFINFGSRIKTRNSAIRIRSGGHYFIMRGICVREFAGYKKA